MKNDFAPGEGAVCVAQYLARHIHYIPVSCARVTSCGRAHGQGRSDAKGNGCGLLHDDGNIKTLKQLLRSWGRGVLCDGTGAGSAMGYGGRFGKGGCSSWM